MAEKNLKLYRDELSIKKKEFIYSGVKPNFLFKTVKM
jgi:hypothetical protein